MGRRLPPVAALTAFDAAARLLSFRRAADDLGLTPSAVSHQIKALELQLGCELFVRLGRSVRLTLAGERMAPHVRRGLEAIERGAAAATDGQTDQVVRISAPALFCEVAIVPHLHELTRRGIELSIESSSRLVEFGNEDVDAAIRIGTGPWPGLRRTELLRITGLPVASPALLARHSATSIADLIKLPLIHDKAQPDAWSTWISAHGLSARTRHPNDLMFDSAPLALEAARRGLGVALAIDPLVRHSAGYGLQLVPALDLPSRVSLSYWFVRRPQSDSNRRVRVVAGWLSDVCRRLATTS